MRLRTPVTLALALVLTATLVPAAVAQPDDHSPPGLSVAEFARSLREQDPVEADAFNDLAPGRQQRLVALLNNQQLMARVLDTMLEAAPNSGLQPGDRRQVGSFAGGDVVIVEEYTEEQQLGENGAGVEVASADASQLVVASGTITATRTRYLYIWGIKIIRLATWVRYYYSGSYARRAYSAGSWYTNYNPIWSISRKTTSPWISSGWARARTYWHIVTGIAGYGVTSRVCQSLYARPGSTRLYSC